MKKTMMFLAAGLLLALSPVYGSEIGQGGSTTSLTAFDGSHFTDQLAGVHGTGATGSLSYTYDAQVYADANNPFCAGCLDFVYQVYNTNQDNIDLVSTGSFDGWRTDVGYMAGTNLPTLGFFVPDSISRTTGNDSAINFNYHPTEIGPAQWTSWLVIATNTHWFTSGTITAQDGVSANGAVPVFAPSVPEPMSMGLMGGGLLLLGLLGYRRRKTVKL